MDEKRRRTIWRRRFEMNQQQPDGSRRVSVATVRREHVVADVDLSALEPVAIGVEVDPSNDCTVDHDARCWLWIACSWREPPSPFLVASGE